MQKKRITVILEPSFTLANFVLVHSNIGSDILTLTVLNF